MSSTAPASDRGRRDRAAGGRAGRPLFRASRRRAAAVTLAAALTLAGCAASAALRQGRDAERMQDYDRAVVEYTKAVRLRPDDPDARLALERAKLRASQDHYARGRRLAALGKLDEALIEYETAAELNPTN